MENLKLKIYSNQEAIDNLAEEWSSLEPNSCWAIYSRRGWFMAWWKTFGHRARLIIVTARANGKLVGILPICQRRTDKHGLFFHIAEPLSGAQADYQCPIVKSGWEEVALPAMFEKVWDAIGHSGTFIWPNLPIENAAVSTIRDLIKRNNLLSIERKEVCPRFVFEKDYNSMEKLWSQNHRTDVRRRRRRLNEKGMVRLWVATTKDEIKQILPEFFQVHDSKWHSQGLPGKFDSPLIQRYHYNMVDYLWDKGLHFSTLKCNGKHISYHFGFLSGGWLLWYKPTYRIEYQNFSPSKVHVSYLIEEGIKAGWKGFDFLLGDEPYKNKWATQKMETTSFIIGFRRLSPSYFWFSCGKSLVKRKFWRPYAKMNFTKEKFFGWAKKIKQLLQK